VCGRHAPSNLNNRKISRIEKPTSVTGAGGGAGGSGSTANGSGGGAGAGGTSIENFAATPGQILRLSFARIGARAKEKADG
jgi:hypothetical protein